MLARPFNVHSTDSLRECNGNNIYKELSQSHDLSDEFLFYHKRNKKRLGCSNFINILSIEPNFCREIEHIILTNLLFFVFGIVTFCRENNAANFAPKKLNNN